MMFIFRLILTLNATLWMILIYVAKEEWTVCGMPSELIVASLAVISVLLSALTIYLTRFTGSDTLEGCKEFSLADNEFLPIYLGYFFVSLSVPNGKTMLLIYSIVFIFTFMSQTQYFNPVFMLFGYHYYHILTNRGTKVFVLVHGKVIRKKSDICFENLGRINDTTYIERRRRR